MHCREHAVQLHAHREEIEASGAVLHIIGNGSPSFIEGFREKTGYTGSIFTDPSRKTYEAAGLVRSVAATVHPRSIVKGLKAMTQGRFQGRTQGDPWQQGGALVVSPAGEVLFAHQARESSDNIEPQALLDALAAAA